MSIATRLLQGESLVTGDFGRLGNEASTSLALVCSILASSAAPIRLPITYCNKIRLTTQSSSTPVPRLSTSLA